MCGHAWDGSEWATSEPLEQKELLTMIWNWLKTETIFGMLVLKKAEGILLQTYFVTFGYVVSGPAGSHMHAQTLEVEHLECFTPGQLLAWHSHRRDSFHDQKKRELYT